MMKKLLSMILVIVMCVTLCIGASASGASENVIVIDNVEVIFDSTSTLSTVEKQAIAAYLVCGDSDVQTYNLMCTLFGHQNTTEYVTTITHCAQEQSPRCLRKIWEVNTCTRCDSSVESTVIGKQYIDCCPVE